MSFCLKAYRAAAGGKWAEGSDESDAMIEMEAQGSDKP